MQQDYSYRPRQPSSSSQQGTFTAEQAAALISRHLATRTPKKFDGRCPYVGPVPFTEADARLYFGRENLIDELLDRAERTRFIAVVGPENSGKTSLINAGLIFGLRNGALRDSDKWLLHRFTPGDDPLRALADACAALGEKAGLAGVMTDAIRKRGLTGPNALNDLVEMLLGADKYRRAVLIIDQFEEIFTRAKSGSDAQAFISFLTQAAQNANSRAIIVMALRSEFLPNCDAYPELAALLGRSAIRLEPMSDAELARAIVLPALETGAQIEPQLVARLVRDVQDDPTQLPKLQLVLKDLFLALPTKHGQDKVLALADYIDFGPIRKRDEDVQPIAPSKAGKTLVGQLAASTKAPLRESLGEARAVSHFAEQAAMVRRMRIFTAIAAVVAVITLSVGVFGAIATNQAEQRAAQSAAAQATAQTNATQSAQAAAQSDSARATAMVQATQAAEARDVAVATRTAAEAAATDAASNQQAALNDKAAAMSAQATALAIATQGVVEVNRGVAMQATVNALATTSAADVQAAMATREATQSQLASARSRELAAVALTQIASDPQLALLIALEAERTLHTQQSDDAVRQTFVAAFPDEGLFRVGSPVNDAQFSPDGRWLLTASRDGRVKLWDIASRQVLTTISAHVGAVNAAVFSKDGARLVTGGADRTVRVWDAATGKSVVVLSGHTGPVNSVNFSDDGKLVVSGGADKTVRVWDVAAGKLVTAPIQLATPVSFARFSAPNQIVVRDAEDHWHLFDTATGNELGTPTVDVLTLATVNEDNTATVAVASEGISFKTPAQPAAINRTAFDADEKRVLLANADGTVRILWVNLSDVIAAATNGQRQFTCEERVRYLSESQDCSAVATPTPEK